MSNTPSGAEPERDDVDPDGRLPEDASDRNDADGASGASSEASGGDATEAPEPAPAPAVQFGDEADRADSPAAEDAPTAATPAAATEPPAPEAPDVDVPEAVSPEPVDAEPDEDADDTDTSGTADAPEPVPAATTAPDSEESTVPDASVPPAPAEPEPTTASDGWDSVDGTGAAAAPAAAAASASADDAAADAEAAERSAAEAKQAELDAAVQRAAAVPLPEDDQASAAETEPEEPARRETYVAPVAGATAVGAAALAPEPAAPPAAAPAAPHAPQTVYVQAPTPPKTKGNRGFGVLVALLGTLIFALLFLGAAYLLLTLQQGPVDAAASLGEFVLLRAVFWVPVVAFFIGFALLAAIVNRGPYWPYAVFAILVGALTYVAFIGGALLTVQAWTLTLEQAQAFIGQRWTDPYGVSAGLIASQVPIWLGGWIAAHGRTVAARNREAREAYDRELAAGPKPYGA